MDSLVPQTPLGQQQVTVMLKHIELKTGFNDKGPAWIARVKVLKSGRTIYFNGRALKQGSGGPGNFSDLETHEPSGSQA